MRKKKSAQLEAMFGALLDGEYFEEDMRGIQTYYAYRKANRLDPFYVDATTWGDLAMDEVFKRLNATLSTSGEQCLYAMLRTPSIEAATYDRRAQLIAAMEADPALRRTLQGILLRVGKCRAANTVEAFHPSAHSPLLFIATVALMLALVGCIAGVLFSGFFAVPLLAVLFINAGFHAFMMHRLERDMTTVNYSVAMVAACRRMRKLRMPQLRDHLQDFFAAGERSKSIARMRGVSITATSDLATYVNLFLLTDIFVYERLKNRLARHHADIFRIHETLGMLDAAIAIASYRKSIAAYAMPAITFDADAPARLVVEGLVHPLLSTPVPNSLTLDRPLLVTGSNASGKSTFLKAVMINAILAQSICTAQCAAYAGTAFCLYTSMAIADNVLAGDSYFIAEIKSIKRILDASQRDERILCVIDEVLRGTNTVERIAASSELLHALERAGVLCLAATHDGELCGLLPAYRQVHFSETIADGEVLFDYRLKQGPATTRNAIKLLAMLGFDEALVANAQDRAEQYLHSGRWENVRAITGEAHADGV